MVVLKDAAADLGESRVFFMHNWRCAGSTLNSLFSSNFGNKYLKIGTQFSEFGWPLYQLPELLTLKDVRSKVESGCLMGGHLCNGIEMLMPGSWDLWMNARDPVKRLSSGIKRFHSKAFRLPSGEYRKNYVKSHSEKAIIDLFNGPLRHEKNGVAKRLAGFSLANNLHVHRDVNLELLSCFDSIESDKDLASVAEKSLEKVKIFLLPDYLHASLICIEKAYGLGPLINLFSDLRHNSVELGKAKAAELTAFNLAMPLLEDICQVDRHIFEIIKQKFAQQLRSTVISRNDVLAREKLHETPLLNPEWFQDKNIDEQMLLKLIVERLESLAAKYPNISREIVETATSWSRFDIAAAQEIKKRAFYGLGLHV